MRLRDPTSPPIDGAQSGARVGERSDAGDDLVDGEPGVTLRVHGPVHLRSLWTEVSELASRTSGSVLSSWQAIEAVCAEAASALPNGAGVADEQALVGAAITRRDVPVADARCAVEDSRDTEAESESHAALRRRLDSAESVDVLRVAVEAGLGELIDPVCSGDVDDLTAQELDAALRAVLHSMRGIDWRLGRLLFTFRTLGLHRHAGYASFADYVEQRLGFSSRKARSLARIEGDPAHGRGALAEAYRDGRLSWVRMTALLPVLSEKHAAAWIERARRVTVRRLLAEVRWALDLRDRTWLGMELVPPPLGARLESSDTEAERQMHARYDDDTADRILATSEFTRHRSIVLKFSGPASVIALLRDMLAAYRDPENPWEPAWKALERMFLHVKAHWGGVPRHRNPIHERDGWRCRVPACGSRRNLQEHHVLYRSRGGDNRRGNRVSICAWHHLRGIHGGVVRAHGDAEASIRWQLGPNLRFVDDTYADETSADDRYADEAYPAAASFTSPARSILPMAFRGSSSMNT